jgi:hypothetical protein
VDVGEDYLDIATLAPDDRRLSLARVDLRQIAPQTPRRTYSNPDTLSSLRAMLADVVPELCRTIWLVDSPRWPRDLDWTQPGAAARPDSPPGRELDASLRALLATLRNADPDSTLAPLSMFPTPPMRYFGAHLNAATCKPHLRPFGKALFGEALNREYGAPSGGIFTRFMIAGFATYRALEGAGGEVYECYPDLQFRLWCRGRRLVSKNSATGRAAALASRIHVLSALARQLGVRGLRQIHRMDEADASILSLSAAAARQCGATWVVQNAEEGIFMVAVDEAEARRLKQGWHACFEGCGR